MSKTQKAPQCPNEGREAAIRNLGGMIWLYEKHAAKFRNCYSDSADRISELLDMGKSDEARRLAHSVKGLAGTLGFSGLYCAAAELESAISDASPSMSARLAFYESQLQSVISGAKNE